jgi:4-hydroxythreonine-4-phosphate dehydrogenase
MKPVVGVLLGDPNGVGPELAAKLLAAAKTRAAARVLAIGDLGVFRAGAAVAGVEIPLNAIEDAASATFDPAVLDFLSVPTIAPEEVTPGRAGAAGGRSVYETVKVAVALAKAGDIDGFCFAPMNKGALKAGGSPHGDEHILFAELLGYDGPYCEHNVLGDLWTTRATSHIPLKDVAGNITTGRVLEMTRLAHRTLSGAGYGAPRIAVCALNPHGGDGGLFGREEIDVIAPAVEAARAEGIAAQGPFPADTVFLKARDGAYDAVVTMYHDQGQIAMKLMGFGSGVTVSGGLPVPIATPASGTAFDIVGKGVASAEGMRQAFLLVCRMAATKKARDAAAQ